MNEEMKKRIRIAMQKVWSAIGHDAEPFCDDKDDQIEFILDADRLDTHGDDPEAAKAMYELSWDEMTALAKELF